MRLRPLVLAAMATAGATTAAWGQSMPTVPTGSDQREIKFGVRAGLTYDSNVARANDATANARNIEPRDVTFRPQATVAITQPLGQQVFVLQGSGGYDFYSKNKRLNRQRIDLTSAGIGHFFSCQETVFASFRSSQTELQDLDLGTTQNLQRTKGLGAALACGRPNGLQSNIVVQGQQAKNSAATRAVSDSDTRVVSATLAYGRPSLGTATLFYSYADSQFPNRVTLGRPVGDGFFTQTLGLGYGRKFGSRFFVNGMLSRTRLKREFAPAGLPLKLTTTTYSGSAEYRASTRLSVTGDLAREIVPSQRTGKLYDIHTSYNGAVRYKVGTRITVSAGDSYETTSSNVDTASALFVVTRSRDNTVFGAINYRQNDHTSFILDVRQQNRKTNLPSFNFTDTRAGLSVDFSF